MSFDQIMTGYAYAGFMSVVILYAIYFYVRKNN